MRDAPATVWTPSAECDAVNLMMPPKICFKARSQSLEVSLAIWDRFFFWNTPRYCFYLLGLNFISTTTDQLAFRRITRTVSVSLRVSDTGACDKSRPLGDLLTLSPRGGNCPIG